MLSSLILNFIFSIGETTSLVNCGRKGTKLINLKIVERSVLKFYHSGV